MRAVWSTGVSGSEWGSLTAATLVAGGSAAWAYQRLLSFERMWRFQNQWLSNPAEKMLQINSCLCLYSCKMTGEQFLLPCLDEWMTEYTGIVCAFTSVAALWMQKLHTLALTSLSLQHLMQYHGRDSIPHSKIIWGIRNRYEMAAVKLYASMQCTIFRQVRNERVFALLCFRNQSIDRVCHSSSLEFCGSGKVIRSVAKDTIDTTPPIS